MMESEQTANVKTFGSPPIPVQDVVDDAGNTYCQIHTDVQTALRCNNCGRLMCAKCAVHTPVGYRCEQCVRQLENRFFNANQAYYGKVFAVSAVLGALGAVVTNLIGWWLLVFFIAAAAGGIISEAVLRVTKGERGRYAAQAAAGGVVVGVLIAAAGVAIALMPSADAVREAYAQYGADAAQQMVEAYNRSRLSFFFSAWMNSLLRIPTLLYTGMTAFIVYGRFNIYRGRR